MIDRDFLLLNARHELGLLAEEEMQVCRLLAEGVVITLNEVPSNFLLGHVGVLGRMLLRDRRDGLRHRLNVLVGAKEAVGRTRDVLGSHGGTVRQSAISQERQ
jgi:hypothetical protein